MPGLVPGIHVFMAPWFKDVDGRNKCDHDVEGVIPGEGRGSTYTLSAMDSLPLRCRSGRE
jgi:hypothetical protein